MKSSTFKKGERILQVIPHDFVSWMETDGIAGLMSLYSLYSDFPGLPEPTEKLLAWKAESNYSFVSWKLGAKKPSFPVPNLLLCVTTFLLGSESI